MYLLIKIKSSIAQGYNIGVTNNKKHHNFEQIKRSQANNHNPSKETIKQRREYLNLNLKFYT
jgi:hypothetical protein